MGRGLLSKVLKKYFTATPQKTKLCQIKNKASCLYILSIWIRCFLVCIWIKEIDYGE